MKKVNRLSRRLDWKVGVENDNESQKWIKEEWICSLAKVVIKGPEVDILEKVLREDEWQIKRFNVEQRESIYAKEWEVENGDNLVTLWCADSWTWRKIKDDRVGDEELLVARSNKGHRKIYG